MALNPVIVRAMKEAEFPVARAVQIAAFDDPTIGDLLDALRDSWVFQPDLSFVAEQDGEIIGHLLYSTALVDAPPELVEVLVLSPVGVRPDCQLKGIGSMLITESLAALQSRPEPAVFLEGNPVYYSRFGFIAGADLGFTKPSVRIPDKAFQVHKLPSWTAKVCGALVYPDAFWRTDSVGLR